MEFESIKISTVKISIPSRGAGRATSLFEGKRCSMPPAGSRTSLACCRAPPGQFNLKKNFRLKCIMRTSATSIGDCGQGFVPGLRDRYINTIIFSNHQNCGEIQPRFFNLFNVRKKQVFEGTEMVKKGP